MGGLVRCSWNLGVLIEDGDASHQWTTRVHGSLAICS